MLSKIKQPVGLRTHFLTFLLLMVGLGMSQQASADFLVGSCTIKDPITTIGIGTECPGQALSSEDFTGLDLRYSDFTTADLSGATLDSADLTDANFQGADWTGISLAGGVVWGNTICPDGTNSNQYIGNGCVGTFSDDDGDGVQDANDDFPTNNAAAYDTDADGYPDLWNKDCDQACQTGSGLERDMFPEHAAAYRDDDFDGFPDQWNAGCDATCQTNSGLALDAGELYVDANKTWAGSDGLSWTNAFPNVADALAVATPGQEIWIAQGVYYPDEAGGGNSDLPADTFTLQDDVNLVGGFSGSGTETMANQADPKANTVVLSGDITQNDTNVVNGVHTAYQSGDIHNATNSHTIVTANAVNSRISGLVISGGGSAEAGENLEGGGLHCTNSNIALRQVGFVYNRVISFGGAIYCNNSTGEKLILEDVHMEGNHSGNVGGGIYLTNGFMEIRRSTINNNTANYGGGIAQNAARSKISNSTIAYNVAAQGGGIHATGTGSLFGEKRLIMSMVTLAFNSATTDFGGGIYTTNFIDAEINGSVILGNTAATTTSGNIYRTTSDEFAADFTSVGASSNALLHIAGGGASTLAVFFNAGLPASVSVATSASGALLNNTLVDHGGFAPVLPTPNTSLLRNIIYEAHCYSFLEQPQDQRGFQRPYEHDINSCDLGAYEANDFDSDTFPDNLDSDIDGDNMPNTFEDANGLDSFNPADASNDPDGDTLTNLQEYNFGTDPQVANISEPDQNLTISPRNHRYGFESASCQSLATPVTYTVANHSGEIRNIGSITFDEMQGGDWQLVTGQDNCSSNALSPAGTCTFQVVFCSTSAGNRVGVINVVTDDADTPNLRSAMFNYESDMDEAQRRLPPVLSDLVIRDSGSTIITNGQIKGGEVHSYEWTITGYHPSYDSLLAAFNCDLITPPNCGDVFNSNYSNSGMLSPGTFGSGSWTYNGIIANTYTYTTSFSLPYNAAESNEWVLRFYRNSEQDVTVGNSSLSLLIPGNIMPTASGYYDTSGRRIKIQVIP